MLNRTYLIFILLLLSGCSSTESTKADKISTVPASEFSFDSSQIQISTESSARKKVADFRNADFFTVVKPYLDSLNQIESFTEEQICEPESLRLYDEMLSLNRGSIYIKTLKLNCTRHQLSDPEYFDKLTEIIDIAAVLLNNGSGESIDKAIEIRELTEVYAIYELAGVSVLDAEIEFHNGKLYYKLHLWDTEKEQFFYRYASNIKFFSKVFSSASHFSVSQKQASKLLYDALIESKAGPALPHLFQDLALYNKFDKILDFQTAVQATAVGQLRLAQAALMLERDDILEFYLDNILGFSDQGMIEATSFIAHFLFIKDPEHSWNEVQAELANIDSLASEGVGMELFLKSLSFRSDFDIQLEKLMSVSNGEAFKGIQDYKNYLQSLNNSSSLDYSSKIDDVMNLLAIHGDSEAKLALARQIFQQTNQTKEELQRARDLLESAAHDGYHEAQLSLGLKYANGSDAYPLNKSKALELYQLAAAQGNPFAFYNIALYYRLGTAVEVNLPLAIEYYEKALEAGVEDVHCILGEVYRTNMKPANFTKAEEHYSKGIAEPGESDRLKLCYEGLGVLQRLEHQDYKKALATLQKATELGSGYSAYQIALLYDDPKSKMQDISKSIEYYEKAISLGYKSAGANLGYIYEAGKNGIQKDNKKALAYYQIGAKAKGAQAMNNLATFYLNGIEIEKDVEKAVDLYKQAADMGNDFAAENYGDLLWEGKHLPRNYIEACDYYEIAYKQQYIDAYYDLAHCYATGKGRYKDPNKALMIYEEGLALGHNGFFYNAGFVSKDDKQYAKAEEYFKRAIEQGSKDAHIMLAATYLEQMRFEDAYKTFKRADEIGLTVEHHIAKMQLLGQGTPQNIPAAMEILEGVTQSISVNTYDYVGDLFYFPFFGEPDYGKALEYYSQKDSPGGRVLNLYGEMYRFGQHVDKDLAIAADYYQQAAEKGHGNAFFNMGEMYRDGEFFEKDLNKAGEMFLTAANMGLPYAMVELSELYLDGSLTEPSDKNAEYWLRKSLENSEDAWLPLGELLLRSTDAETQKEGKYWLTLALQSQAEDAELRLQELGITKDDLHND